MVGRPKYVAAADVGVVAVIDENVVVAPPPRKWAVPTTGKPSLSQPSATGNEAGIGTLAALVEPKTLDVTGLVTLALNVMTFASKQIELVGVGDGGEKSSCVVVVRSSR